MGNILTNKKTTLAKKSGFFICQEAKMSDVRRFLIFSKENMLNFT
ncbi:MAG: hypothetical protein [Bacteriophage sp.]|jgi:hypothetical protein|nr:MAG: hypothetical protein [Bacteriophage sp.]UVY24193.1 MAG: hypothetical protein [Bacteriophage sp.]